LTLYHYRQAFQKNTLVQQALVKFLDHGELGRIPLVEQIVEVPAKGIAQIQAENFKNAIKKSQSEVSKIIGWINQRQIWTKSHGSLSGAPSPGIYGRNLVVGFNDTLNDESTFVISRNLGSNWHLGAASYCFEATAIEDWEEWMHPVEILQKDMKS
jgi:hypothetical protein